MKLDLDAQPPETLAKWWCELNRGGWPSELGDPPADKIMKEIMSIIGTKECLREWNKDSMSNNQFEIWWRSRARH